MSKQNKMTDITLLATAQEERRLDAEKLLLMQDDTGQGMNIFALLIAIFKGIQSDSGLQSQNVISQLSSAMGVDGKFFSSTYKSFNSGEITAQEAAQKTLNKVTHISEDDVTNAMTVVAKYAETGNPLLELIGAKESASDYNRVYSGNGVHREDLTGMSINQVIAWQKNYTDNGSYSSAAGKYQIIRKTLTGLRDKMGLTGEEPYDEEMQDRMGMKLLKDRGYDDYKAGHLPEDVFMRRISQEWASMPEDERGLSYYNKDGVNKSHTTPATLIAAMRTTKDGEGLAKTYNENIAKGGTKAEDSAEPVILTAAFEKIKHTTEEIEQEAIALADAETKQEGQDSDSQEQEPCDCEPPSQPLYASTETPGMGGAV